MAKVGTTMKAGKDLASISYDCIRAFIPLNTSAIPDLADITAASLWIYAPNPSWDDNCRYVSNPGQEDTYPQDGNGCGDACEYIGNLDKDGEAGVHDVLIFNQHFARRDFTQKKPCNGDFDCDGDVDDEDYSLLQ